MMLARLSNEIRARAILVLRSDFRRKNRSDGRLVAKPLLIFFSLACRFSLDIDVV